MAGEWEMSRSKVDQDQRIRCTATVIVPLEQAPRLRDLLVAVLWGRAHVDNVAALGLQFPCLLLASLVALSAVPANLSVLLPSHLRQRVMVARDVLRVVTEVGDEHLEVGRRCLRHPFALALASLACVARLATMGDLLERWQPLQVPLLALLL